MVTFEVFEVEEALSLGDEQQGTKRKFWIEAEDGRRWLFKYNRDRDSKRPGGCEALGEDWAEGIAGELAKYLGIPHALTFLGRCRDPEDDRMRRGVIA
jgi:hypothetical protein